MGAALTREAVQQKTNQAASVDAYESVLSSEHQQGAPAGFPLFLKASANSSLRIQRKPNDDPADEADEQLSIQAKLIINPAGDTYEQEADSIAEAAKSGAASQTETPAAEEDLRQKPLDQNPAAPVTTESNLRTPDSGMPLSSTVRRKVEPLLGADLSHVRVHSSSAANDVARGLQAKAFTHQNHIWLGPSQSSDDVELLAHESAHVVQQRQGRAKPGAVQRKAAAPAIIDDGEQVQQKMMRELARSRGESPEQAEVPKPAEPPAPVPGAANSQPAPDVDRAELEEKKSELAPQAQPPVDRAAEAQPQVDQAANEVKSEAEKSAEPLAEAADQGAPEGGGEGGEKGADDPAGAAASLADQAFAMAGSEAGPETKPLVMPPTIAPPVDAGGQPLAPDPEADARILLLATGAQTLRDQGTNLRAGAAQERANASVIRGNLKVAEGGIDQAEAGVATSEEHLSSRREVVGKAKSALEVSEQKAETVASGAPEYQSKSEEGKSQSGPMASESKQLSAESDSKKPDDPEAAAKSQEQGSKLNSVGSDINSVDDAVTQTKAKAESLGQDAAQAKQTNAQTKGKIDATEATLDQTETRLGQMKDQSSEARAHLAGLANGPAGIDAGADAVDQQGIAIVQSSFDIESRLAQVQQSYQQGMLSVPAAPKQEGSSQGPGVVVQRKAEAGAYHDRESVNLGAHITENLPSWLTGEAKQKEADRALAKAREDQRRRDEITEINKLANGNFNNLSAADKAGIALSLTGRHLFSSVGETNWPNFLGHLVQGLVDPRVSLMGVVSGLSMVLTGGANLLSADQWKKDPLGNLLKSAADIATGITIILGSITALALAIIIILTAAAILTLGALGPVAAAVIPFCTTVVSTCGGWTIVAAKVALVLQALVFIKNLIDAATASTANELQQKSDEMTEDAKNAGNMALQIGLAKVMEAGGKALGGTKFGKAVSAEAKAIGEDFGVTKPPAGAAPGEGVPVAGEAPPAVTEAAPAPKPVEPAAAPNEPAPIPKPSEPAAPPKPVEPAPTEAPQTPKPAESAPTEAPQTPKPAEPAPTEAPQTPKPAEPAPTEGPQTPKPAEAAKTPEPAPTEQAAPADPVASATAEAAAQTKGAALAKKMGYPEAEPGYHWAESNGKPVYRRNPLRTEGPKLPERVYDPETGTFKNAETKAPSTEPLEGDPVTTAEKGKFGEQKADAHMEENGFIKRGSHDAPGPGGGKPKPQGIDGVYENTAPPPKWVVGEAKYGTAGYGKTASGKQLSEPWTDARLDHAVGKKMADQIRLEGYERWELRVDESGKVTPTKIDW